MASIVNPINPIAKQTTVSRCQKRQALYFKHLFLNVRIAIEQVKNPYWHEKHGQNNEVRIFWDRDIWDRNLREWASYGYNGIFLLC